MRGDWSLERVLRAGRCHGIVVPGSLLFPRLSALLYVVSAIASGGWYHRVSFDVVSAVDAFPRRE